MVDIAELGFKINSKPLKDAAEQMDKMTKSGEKLERSTTDTGQAIKKSAIETDKYGNSLTQADKAMGRFIDSTGRMREKNGQFVKGMNQANGSLAKFERLVNATISDLKDMAFAGGAAAAAIGAIAATSSATNRELEAQAKQAGVTVEEYQKLVFAAQRAGVAQDEFGDIAKDAQDKIGDFLVTGGGELVDFFETVAPKVGVTADQFKGLSGPAVLGLFIDTLEKANVSQEKAIFFTEGLASEASRLRGVFGDGGEAIVEAGRKMESLGTTISQLEVKRVADLSSSFSLLGTTISNATTRSVSAFKKEIETAVNVTIKGVNLMSEGFIALFDQLRNTEARRSIKGIQKDIGELVTERERLKSGEGVSLVDQLLGKSPKGRINELNKEIQTLQSRVVELIKEAGQNSGQALNIPGLITGQSGGTGSGGTDDISALNNELEELQQKLTDQVNLYGKSEKVLALHSAKQEAINAATAAGTTVSGDYLIQLEMLIEEFYRLQEAENAASETLNDFAESIEEGGVTAKEFADAQEELNKAVQNGEVTYEQAERIIKRLADGYVDASDAAADLADIQEQGLITQEQYNKAVELLGSKFLDGTASGLQRYEEEIKKLQAKLPEDAKDAGTEAGKSFSESFADELKQASLSIGVSIAKGDTGGVVSGLSGAISGAVSTGIADSVTGSLAKGLSDSLGKELSGTISGIGGGIAGGIAGGAISAGISALASAFEHEPTKFKASFKTVDEALLNTAGIAEKVAAVGIDQAAIDFGASINEINHALKNNEGFFEWQNGLDSFDKSALGVTGFVNEGTERLQRAGQGAADWVEGVSAVIGANLDVVAGFAKTEDQLDAMRKTLRSMSIETGNAAEIIEFGIVDQSLAALEAAAIEIPERFREMDAESLAPALFEAQEAAQLLASSGGTLGTSFDALGTSALMLADNAIVAAGGINRLAQLEQGYYRDFFSDTERLWREQVKLNEAFEDLGVETPKTTEQFRSLVEAQDKNTEAGLNMYLQLLELAGAFSSATANAASLSTAVGLIGVAGGGGSGAASSVDDIKDFGDDVAGAGKQFTDAKNSLSNLKEIRDEALQELLDQPEILSELGIDASTTDELNSVLSGYVDELDGAAGVYDAFNDKVVDWLSENGDAATVDTITAIEDFGDSLVDSLTGISDVDLQADYVSAAADEFTDASREAAASSDENTESTKKNTGAINDNSAAVDNSTRILSQENSLLKEFNSLGEDLAKIINDESLAIESANNLHQMLKDTIFKENIELFNSVTARKNEIKAINAAIEAAENARDTVENAFEVVENSIGRSIDAINDDYDAQIQALEDSAEAEKERAAAVRDATEQAINDIESLRSLLDRGIQSLQSSSPAATQARAQSSVREISKALKIAVETGMLPTADALESAIDGLTDINADQFSTFEEFSAAQSSAANDLRKLDELAGEQLSFEEQALANWEISEENREDQHKQSIEALEDQRKIEVSQLEQLLESQKELAGLSEDVLTVDQSIKNLQSALIAEMRAVSDVNEIAPGAVQDLSVTGTGALSVTSTPGEAALALADLYGVDVATPDAVLNMTADQLSSLGQSKSTSSKDTEFWRTLAQFQTGGYTGNMPENEVAGIVHGREGVLNAGAMANVGIPALNMMNSGMSPADIFGGGVTIDVSSIVSRISALDATVSELLTAISVSSAEAADILDDLQNDGIRIDNTLGPVQVQTV